LHRGCLLLHHLELIVGGRLVSGSVVVEAVRGLLGCALLIDDCRGGCALLALDQVHVGRVGRVFRGRHILTAGVVRGRLLIGAALVLLRSLVRCLLFLEPGLVGLRSRALILER
jgi:hypothetical protein